MQLFRTIDDIRKARFPPDLEKIITEQMETLIAGYGNDFNPDHDGCIVLLEAGTEDEDFRLLTGTSVTDAIFESVDRVGHYLVAIWLGNNQYGITFVLDSSEQVCVDPAIRNRFLSEIGDGNSGRRS